MASINIKDLVTSILGFAKPFIGMFGGQANSVVERGVTLPERDVRAMCAGMTEAEIKEAIALGHTFADAFADFIVYVASRGNIDPD